VDGRRFSNPYPAPRPHSISLSHAAFAACSAISRQFFLLTWMQMWLGDGVGWAPIFEPLPRGGRWGVGGWGYITVVAPLRVARPGTPRLWEGSPHSGEIFFEVYTPPTVKNKVANPHPHRSFSLPTSAPSPRPHSISITGRVRSMFCDRGNFFCLFGCKNVVGGWGGRRFSNPYLPRPASTLNLYHWPRSQYVLRSRQCFLPTWVQMWLGVGWAPIFEPRVHTESLSLADFAACSATKFATRYCI
jgi:hypothetical protein